MEESTCMATSEIKTAISQRLVTNSIKQWHTYSVIQVIK